MATKSTTTSSIRVAPLDDEDIPTCFQVLSESFGHSAPFVDAYFPRHETPAGRAQGAGRLAAWRRHARDSTTFLKAVTSVVAVAGGEDGTRTEGEEKEEERVVGLAVWTHMREVPSPRLEDAEADVDGVWPDPADRAFMAGLWEDYVKPRSQAVRESQGEGVYVLELLAVHPGYQRLGAGAALVTWGTMAADELQVKAVVEGTPAGRRVYEKCGLRVEIEEMPFDLLQGFTDRAKPKLAFMTREPVP